MCNARSYGFWGELTEALKTGQPQTEVKLQGPHELLEPSGVAVELLEDRLAGEARAHRSPTFTSSPSGSTSLPNETVCDVGRATGQLCTTLAGRYPHLRCTTYDLPVVAPIAQKSIAASGLYPLTGPTSAGIAYKRLQNA